MASGACGEIAGMTGGVTDAAKLNAVSHFYGATTALSDVSVSIPAGGMIGVIGPDGVGKSTLQALIAGVRKVQSGVVAVLDGDIADRAHRESVCSRIAYMPQGLGRNLYPTLSVYENVDFFGRLFGQSEAERRWRIADLLTSTGLDPFPDRPAGKLSGGMKQKLALCCSLIHDPDLLILDEPTTGVDPLSRRQFWELIARIRVRRPTMTVVTATAYMEEADQFDTLIAMNGGRVIATGTPSELKERTGTTTLEAAFIALLPERDRGAAAPVRKTAEPHRDGGAAIEAEHLSIRFGDFIAVDDVSVRIERGEIFGFLGSNGCGKTTTMKALTGLLPPSSGVAKLFGKAVDARDIETRRRVGYMSQSFSLYGELSVRQNLELHARLYQLPKNDIDARVLQLLQTFTLGAVADARPESLPLGVRQRLQLAVAMLHRPEILILDEPTSGVDPIARDQFWDMLQRLSHEDGVTIFISTHYINEAERCDRISLMHRGRILAVDAPDGLRRARGADTLEDAFIGLLEEAAKADEGEGAKPEALPPPAVSAAVAAPESRRALLDFRRIWALARRESMELVRDPIRIAFSLAGPLILAVAMGFGISFDIEDVRYAVFDQDRSQESQSLRDAFSNSRYFSEQPTLSSQEELDRRLMSADINFAIGIPPDFGRDLVAGRQPELGVWLDGANAFRAETARGYVQGVLSGYLSDLSREETGSAASLYPADIETRFRYNQAFLSLNAIAPGVMMLLIMLFSVMLTTLGVVREKELGSITNLYAAPVSKLEFLIGKQLPYVAIAMVSFINLTLLITLGFGVALEGSFLALLLGALLLAFAATAFGLVISAFVSSQIAAQFASAIIVMIPTLNFSGMMYPVSTLDGGARLIGQIFPALYFQKISSGVFNKGLGLGALYANHLALAAFYVGFLCLAALLLKKQEA
jgi:ribosome-dependent ATPase